MMSRWTLLLPIVLPVLAACAPKPAPGAASAAVAAPPDYTDAPVVRVRSDFYYPVGISLISDGVQRLGTVERYQVRYFHLPARVTLPETYVAIEARTVPLNGLNVLDGMASFTSKLLTLKPGDVVDLRLEHSLSLSTLQVRPRAEDAGASAELRRR
jgi:hypothetical protein